MKVAIIGAGRMGRWFTRFFLREGVRVIVSDKDEEALSKIRDDPGVQIASTEDAVKSADMVLISVPMKDFAAVAREIRPYTRPTQAIIDICTFKEYPVQVMHHYLKAGVTLGIHPMFGPDAKSVKSQNFIFTPTTTEEEALAKKLKAWLEGKSARVFIMSPRKHDRLLWRMRVVPYFIRAHFIGPVDRRFPQFRGFHYWITSLT